jgi:hypothetical protein
MMKPRRVNRLWQSGPLGAALVALLACDSGFDTLNTDDTRLTGVEPVMQLNTAVLNSAPNLTMLQCETSIVKQHARIFTGVGACGNFNVDARETSDNNWANGYQTRLRNVVDALGNSEGNPALANLHQMLRIWRAYTFMRITDSYGDVPYIDAGKGYLEGIVFPDYDHQEFIYTSEVGILEELANATAALDESLPRPTRDVLYGGDVTKWRRLGNSLLLRAAMRLTKVNPTLAAEYAAQAVAGGVMQSNADNAVVRHTAEYRNDPGTSLNGGQAHFNYLVADFVDHLKEMDDPRLAAIAVRYPAATNNSGQNEANADRSPENQIGMPMGYDNTDIGPIVQAQGLPSFYAYSQIDRRRMMDPVAPSFLVTYAQTQLLMAEAAHRGWIQGDPAAFYANGIRAHMEQISSSYANTAIPASDIEAFLQAHPLEAGRELEQINTEYWIASFLIPDEGWANFRRSCYPRLDPNPRQDDLGPDERFMRRFGYPDGEVTVNPNVQNGVTPDQIDTRVWWDVRVSEVC